MKKHNQMFRRARSLLALVAVAATATACIEDDEPIVVDPPQGGLFSRYVSLGNSITAGYQSDGINAELQDDAYPVLLAEMAEAPFGIPALALPGCPPPLVAPLSTERISNDAQCALRRLVLPREVSNFAVPGANVAALSDPLGTGSILNTLLTGGMSQLNAMLAADPSLVSVWIGNNDALAAALSGQPAALTSLDAFQTEYDEIVEGIQASTAQDAILIGVVNAIQAAPALQPGAYFWALEQSGQSPVPLDVNDNCAPFTLLGQPNPQGFQNLVSILAVQNQLPATEEDPVVISCADDAPFVLNPEEQATVSERVAAFNAYIQQQAEENDWIYIDPATQLFGPALADPDLIRKCQGFYDGSVTDAQSFMAAVQNTCPGPTAPNFFGAYISFDAVHPSAAAHAVVADVLAAELEEKHGLTLIAD